MNIVLEKTKKKKKTINQEKYNLEYFRCFAALPLHGDNLIIEMIGRSIGWLHEG